LFLGRRVSYRFCPLESFCEVTITPTVSAVFVAVAFKYNLAMFALYSVDCLSIFHFSVVIPPSMAAFIRAEQPFAPCLGEFYLLAALLAYVFGVIKSVP